jgi:hypothetical protein
MNYFAETADQNYRHNLTMYECLLCRCREVKSRMKKHHLQEHLTPEKVPFLCKACDVRFLLEAEAKKHHQRKHSMLEFDKNFQRSTSPFSLKKDRARSLGQERSLQLFEEEARNRRVVDEVIERVSVAWGPQSNLLLTQVQAFANKGTLVPAIKSHLKATEKAVVPAASAETSQTPQKREEEFLRELEVSDDSCSDDDEPTDEQPFHEDLPDVPAARGGHPTA